MKKAVLAAAAVAAVFVAWKWWTSDERVIRRRLADVAEIVSVPSHDSDLGRLARVARLRRYLAENVRVAAGNSQVASRELVLAAASQWTPFPGGVTVEFLDVHVNVDADRLGADADLTAKITATSPQPGDETVDAQEVRVALRKIGGEWLISEARTEPILSIAR